MPGPAQTPTATERVKVALLERPRLYDWSRRPYALARYWLRRPHEPAYAAFACFPERAGLFLDVGANVGMSALSFRVYRDDPVLSIEPNPFHERDLAFLKRFVLSDFDYRLCAAGAHAGDLTLYIPVYHGVPLTTEASLSREQVQDSPSLRGRLGHRMTTSRFTIEARRVPVRPLDDLELDPAFIKLDVQGFEHEALLGLERTIARSRPVLMVETPSAEVRSLLAAASYATRTYDPAGRRLVAEEVRRDVNTLFVPL
jgi:FkbM family methyltransferase